MNFLSIKKIIFATILISLSSFTIAQKFIHKDYWVDIKNIKSLERENKVRYVKPTKYRLVGIDFPMVKDVLDGAPHEREVLAEDSKLFIEIPLPDNRSEVFSVVQTQIMEDALQAQNPDIKTFMGVSVENPNRKIFMDYTLAGFHGMIYDKGKLSFIEPLYKGETEYYQVYDKRDNTLRESPWICSTTSIEKEEKESPVLDFRANACNKFRNYRLAIATTYEYSTYHGGTLALVTSAVTTSVNRVSGVYTMEIGCRLTMVSNTNTLFSLTSSDAYTNTNGNTMLGQNQTECDTKIGTANYDIGHVFSTGGGGVAYLGCICTASSKAGGVTGSSDPVGDPFDIDYVAHEMGHQFGGNHTFSSNQGSCSGNGSTISAVEPGSGSTIMAYAGICSPTNVQSNSDAYFSFKSLDQIMAEVLTNDCSTAVPTAMTNTAPTVTVPSSTYSIPISTPFVLTANGSDVNGDAITYCWEQTNAGSVSYATAPTSGQTAGPVFRSYSPVTVPYRHFPRQADILAGTNGNTWEVLPSVARTMGFRVVVRDQPIAPAGQLAFGCFSETNVSVTTVAAAGPFVVTSPSAGVNWTPGTNQTITWNVAGTTAAPINCANVDISISTDGGNSWAILANDTPNDGSQVITAPNVISANTYILVSCSNNIFYDVNPGSFTISNGVSSTCQQVTNNTVAAIGTSANITVSTSSNITLSGNVSDVNICNVTGTHTYISDLSFFLIGPTGASANLISRICGTNDNFNLGFDSQSALTYSSIPCPPVDGLIYQPNNTLNIFNGLTAAGSWTIRVADNGSGDGGQLSSWCLNVCTQTLLNLLPITLKSFEAKASTESIFCNWTTSDELNNVGFNLQRSKDGIKFENIAWVESKGRNSISEQKYLFEDKKAEKGVLYYYRLEHKDINGKGEFSKIATAKIQGNARKITLYPNPIQDKINIQIPNSSRTIVVKAFQVDGKCISDQKFSDVESESVLTVEASQWPTGVFYVEVQDDYGKSIHKVVKEK
jgi:subtilisin-like proprotein convertase family protein